MHNALLVSYKPCPSVPSVRGSNGVPNLARTIPADIIEDEKLVGAIPLFFRTVRDSEKKEENLKELVEYIREQLK